jgi:hypothetical protein
VAGGGGSGGGEEVPQCGVHWEWGGLRGGEALLLPPSAWCGVDGVSGGGGGPEDSGVIPLLEQQDTRTDPTPPKPEGEDEDA